MQILCSILGNNNVYMSIRNVGWGKTLVDAQRLRYPQNVSNDVTFGVTRCDLQPIVKYFNHIHTFYTMDMLRSPIAI